MSVVILIRPVWKHGPRSLVWMRDFGNLNSLIVGNLDRVYLMNQIYSRAVFFPSKSIYTGTRKMVNYTCAGLSQEKFCWRLETILTCKSFVGYEYRGERLIELSSSWFPPKFPSGQLELNEFYQVKRMIRGIGVVTTSTYSQTLNG